MLIKLPEINLVFEGKHKYSRLLCNSASGGLLIQRRMKDTWLRDTWIHPVGKDFLGNTKIGLTAVPEFKKKQIERDKEVLKKW